MYKEDLAFNNLQWSICHKIKPNQTKLIRAEVILMALSVSQIDQFKNDSYKIGIFETIYVCKQMIIKE